MEWEKCGQAWKLLDNLKNEGFEIIALEQDKKAIAYNKFKLPKNAAKIALVVGNEVDGLPPAVLKRADKIIFIPMRGKKESLNVSVAFGIAVYKLAEVLYTGK